MNGQRVEPTLEEREEAKKHPGGWLYRISGHLDPDKSVPPEAVVGAWKVDESGNIEGEFIPNPNYSSS